MTTSINSNLTSTIASNISNLRLSGASRALARANRPVQEIEAEITNNIQKQQEEVREENIFKNKFSTSQIEEMKELSLCFGETLTDEDIRYGIKYGRSVIADYSV
ncbi:hypothetical protein IJC60_03975 [bacterium]|nr:hypothetical protein [bacterium]